MNIQHSSVIFVTLTIVLFLFYLFFIKDSGIKRTFNVPFYYLVLTQDMGLINKGKPLITNGLIGKPDALFKHIIFPLYIVGEAKSRHYKGSVTLYEDYQTTLYSGMVKSLFFFASVRAIIHYPNENIPIPFNKFKYTYLLTKAKPLSALT